MRYNLFVVSIGLVCGSALAGFGQPVTEAPAVDAAKEREQAVRTVAVEFRVVEEVAEGGVTEELPEMPKSQKRKVPAQATALESTNRLVIAGNKTRFERNHPIWATDTGELKQVRMVNTTDGTFDKMLHLIGLTKAEQLEGVLGRSGRANDIKTGILLPLAVWYRGTASALSPVPVAEYRPTGGAVRIGEKECQEYARSGNRSDATFLWFDPGSGNALRRVRTDRNGKPVAQYDIEFRLSEAGVWVPTSWVRNTYSRGGRVLASEKVEVLSTRLNEEYPDRDFDVTFPPGTRIFDIRESKYFMVQNDGTMREYRLDTGELMSETVYQPGTPWAERYWLWIVGASTLCVVVLALVVRRHRKRA